MSCVAGWGAVSVTLVWVSPGGLKVQMVGGGAWAWLRARFDSRIW